MTACITSYVIHSCSLGTPFAKSQHVDLLLRSSYPRFLSHPSLFHFDVLTSNLNHYCDETRGRHRHNWSFPLEAVIRGA